MKRSKKRLLIALLLVLAAGAFLRLGTELVPATEYPFCYWLGFDADGHWPYDFLDKNGRSLIR